MIMAVNRGKQFEETIRQSFLKVPNTSVVRLHDQTMGYLGATNHCDFIVYHEPYEYHIECKSIHGNTLSIYGTDDKHRYGNITNNQWEGLLEKSKIKGVFAGVVCWWIDKDTTLFIPIQMLQILYQTGIKSIRYDFPKCPEIIHITGRKKRIFFDYDMEDFFNALR